MKHKKLFISLTAVFSVIVFLFVFLIVWYFGDSYKDFKNNFRQEFAIPGLDEGAIPQGMGNCTSTYTTTDGNGETVTATQQYFFISAYMADGSPSRIYVTGADTGYEGYVTIKNTDGTDYAGHCGGVATNGSYLWLSDGSSVYVAQKSGSYSNIAQEIVSKAATGGSIKFTASFNANCKASFCFYYDDPSTSSVTSDRLYVGEFYRKGNYETDMKHRVTTPQGYNNTAFVYEYNVSNTGIYGLSSINSTYPDAVNESYNVPEIKKIISIPEKIQGFARVNNMMVLSQSYGLANSHILCYDWSTLTTNTDNRAKYSALTGENFAYEGVKRKSGAPFTVDSLYVYYADNNNADLLLNDYSIPAMSEGLCTVGSRVYVLSESGGQKYNKFVRERVKYVYSVIPHKG